MEIYGISPLRDCLLMHTVGLTRNIVGLGPISDVGFCVKSGRDGISTGMTQASEGSRKQYIHSSSSGSITIVFSLVEVRVGELCLLLQRLVVKFFANGELSVDAILRNVVSLNGRTKLRNGYGLEHC